MRNEHGNVSLREFVQGMFEAVSTAVQLLAVDDQLSCNGVNENYPTNIFVCCRVDLPAAGGSIVVAGVAT